MECFLFINILFIQAIFIDQERYRGINEDRALKQICGYPICSNQLPKDVWFGSILIVNISEIL